MHAFDTATKEFTMYGRDEQYSINVNTTDVNYTPGYGSPMITNRDGSVRNATFDDFLTMANLFHMEKSYDINGGILVQPYDIEAEISIPAMVYATIKRSSKVLFGIQGDEKDQENIFKILEIAFGGKEKLKEKYVFEFWEKVSDAESAVRFCTSWATKPEVVEELIRDIEAC